MKKYKKEKSLWNKLIQTTMTFLTGEVPIITKSQRMEKLSSPKITTTWVDRSRSASCKLKMNLQQKS